MWFHMLYVTGIICLLVEVQTYITNNTVMCHLTAGIHSEKCVIRQFHRCVNIIDCTYTNLDSIAYYTWRLYVALSARGTCPTFSWFLAIAVNVKDLFVKYSTIFIF